MYYEVGNKYTAIQARTLMLFAKPFANLQFLLKSATWISQLGYMLTLNCVC